MNSCISHSLLHLLASSVCWTAFASFTPCKYFDSLLQMVVGVTDGGYDDRATEQTDLISLAC